jgi:hypothetical protein
MGYSTQHKGYQCLHYSTSRVYISQHVVFNKKMFPFHKLALLPSSTTAPTVLDDWLSAFTTTMTSTSPSNSSSTLDKDHALLFILEPLPHSATQTTPPLDTPPSSPNILTPSHTISPPCPSQPTSSHSMITRSQVGIRKPNPKYILTVFVPTVSLKVSIIINWLINPRTFM